MTRERIRAERSRMSMERPVPFTDLNRYIIDASDFIARRAILSGDSDVLDELKKQKNVSYWLPEGGDWDVSHAFMGIGDGGKKMFYRFRSKEHIELPEDDIRKLIIQKVLSPKQIKRWGFIYGVPTIEDVREKSHS